MATILIADDEKNIREGLAQFIYSEGHTVVSAADGAEALARARARDIDCALIDLRMPKTDGGQVLATLVSERPAVPVIIITGHGTVQNAVDAMRNGAYDFVTKPVHLDRLSVLIKRALANRQLVLQNQTLRSALDAQQSTRAPVAASAAMQRVLQTVDQVAKSSATVLITGESGVGKEVIADRIHLRSQRHAAPIIKVHCTSLNETLLESELFGHEKGAFTGAIAQRKGRFELANDGTIFLDEIGEINHTLQVKILRVLQEKQFERVGGEQTIAVNVRIVVATNRNLPDEVASGRFREDLYYRLNVVHIEVPPLRERREDIPLLITQSLQEFTTVNATGPKKFSPPAQELLLRYRWPGNIRELRNCIESAVILSAGDIIGTEYLPKAMVQQTSGDDGIVIPRESSLADAEKIIIKQVLAAAGGNKSKAAAQLGLQRTTLYDKMRRYGLGPS